LLDRRHGRFIWLNGKSCHSPPSRAKDNNVKRLSLLSLHIQGQCLGTGVTLTFAENISINMSKMLFHYNKWVKINVEYITLPLVIFLVRISVILHE